jgi:hypothetical protein
LLAPFLFSGIRQVKRVADLAAPLLISALGADFSRRQDEMLLAHRSSSLENNLLVLVLSRLH